MTETAVPSTREWRAGPARPLLGLAMILGSATLFAVNGTVTKLLLQSGLDALQLATLRATGAGAVLLFVCLLLRPRRLAVRWRELPLLVTLGLTGYFLLPNLYFVAIGRLPVGVALLLEFTAPVFVALWVRFGQRRPVRARMWLGLALCLVGLGFVAEVAGNVRLDGIGVAAALGAAILLASYLVLGERGVVDRDTLSLTSWTFAVAAVAGSVVRPWWEFPHATLGRTSPAGPPVWLLVCSFLVLGTIAPYLLAISALRHLPATSVGIIGMAEPVVAGLVAWLILDEVLTGIQLAGAAMLLGGVVLAETARAPVRRRDEMTEVHPNVQAVQEALATAGVDTPIRILPEAVPTAAAAAAALDVTVGQIANSLVFDADGAPLLVLTSGAHRVDTARVAAQLGVRKLRRASAEFVEAHTGQRIGGVAPVGHPQPLRTLVDTALAGYDQVWAAGGVPRAIFPTSYAELLRITAGSPAEVASMREDQAHLPS